MELLLKAFRVGVHSKVESASYINDAMQLLNLETMQQWKKNKLHSAENLSTERKIKREGKGIQNCKHCLNEKQYIRFKPSKNRNPA